MRFRGQVVVVTGSSDGIGKATAAAFAREGASVVVNGRRKSLLSQARRDLTPGRETVVAFAGDVADPAVAAGLTEMALAKFGRIDVLVNNAGGGSPNRPLESIREADWLAIINANLCSAMRMCQMTIPIMKRQRAGKIINVASLAGRAHSVLAGADYASSKAGLIGLTRQLAWELGPWGVRVNAVAPGVTLSARIAARWQLRTKRDKAQILSSIPLRRLARPEEVASVIAFLASDDASYVTGATIDVNGGSYMG